MKAREIPSQVNPPLRRPRDKRVCDSRGRPVKYLYERGGRISAVMKIAGPDGAKKARRFSLYNLDRSPVKNCTEASEALARLLVDRMADSLPTGGAQAALFRIR